VVVGAGVQQNHGAAPDLALTGLGDDAEEQDLGIEKHRALDQRSTRGGSPRQRQHAR
jgi:hypothetical protein